MPPVRRLTAILAADVAGYSRLMEADEEGTHDRLQTHFRELVNPKVAEHRGRIVKNTGDGFLGEFPSVVDAVRCAVEVQRGMAERNEGTPPEKWTQFRIGINLGDVIVEANDIFGDGVNVAARLEALAEPSGICVSRMVRDNVRDKLDYAFEDLGEQQVKNIVRPVRVYALRPHAVANLPASSAPPATPIFQPAVAPRLSIVVLPFANRSNDPEQQYLADSITEDVTADLSRLGGTRVISCNTAFAYRDKWIDTKQIGRELGVRYVLEGGIRRSASQVRVNTQLIDAATDAHLWAERFDCDTADLFALHDEITSRIAIALNIELIAAEAARPAEHPDALDYILRGRAMRFKPYSRGVYLEAVGLFERALALDPRSVEAQSRLAMALAVGVMADMTDTAELDLLRAEGLAVQALAASSRSRLPHNAKGTVLRAQRRYAEAIPEYETVLALDRNDVSALSCLGQCKLFTGSKEETIPLVERAIQLSPRDPGLGTWYQLIGAAHLLQSRTEEAIHWLEKARNYISAHSSIHRDLAAAYGLRGQIERAAAELAEARALSSDDRYSSIARAKAVFRYSGMSKVRALIDATYIAGLRKAGMPEE